MFALPDDDFSRDQITPYRCSLLILIKEYADFHDEKDHQYPRMFWQDELTSKRHLDRALLTWIQQPNGSLKDMLRTLSFCSKALYMKFTSMLDAICNFDSIGNLENFFSSLGFSVFEEKDSLLNKNGLLGLFCRRMLVYYERLSFCEIQPFFENFITYCSSYITLKQSSEHPKKQTSPNSSEVNFSCQNDKEQADDMELESQSEMDSKSSRESIDAVLKPCELKTDRCEDLDTSEYVGYQQAEFFFAQQASLIEEKESDALPPVALQAKIRKILKSNPDMTEAHYVSYLNNLRLREFCGAIDSLFMYFIRHDKKPKSETPNKSNDKDINRTQRFATLNLALLHLRCGHKKAAMAAVKESISLSQIAKDSICLEHAMSLLNHLEPQMSSHKVAMEIVRPGKSHNLTNLAFMAVQAHMNRVAVDGERPSLVFRHLAAADALQSIKPYTHCSTTSFSHKASLWRMLGKRRMALLHCQLALSMQFTTNKKQLTSPTRYNSEDIALCLSHLIEILNEEGMGNACNDLLCHAKQRFPINSRYSHYWRKAEARLNHKTNLGLCKHVEARQTQNALLLHDVAEARLRTAEYLASRNEILQSHATLLKMLRDNDNRAADDDGLKPEVLSKIYLLMGRTLSRNQYEQGTCFRYLLEALCIAQKCHLHNATNEALLLLAQLQLHSNSPHAAHSCLKSILFECLTNADLHMRSRLLLVAVRCLLKVKDGVTTNDIDRCISTLIQSKDGFEKTQDLARQRDVVYLLARLYDERASRMDRIDFPKKHLESIRQRNDCASEFKRLDIQIGSLKFTLLV